MTAEARRRDGESRRLFCRRQHPQRIDARAAASRRQRAATFLAPLQPCTKKSRHPRLTTHSAVESRKDDDADGAPWP
jgi:hypothetical protein